MLIQNKTTKYKIIRENIAHYESKLKFIKKTKGCAQEHKKGDYFSVIPFVKIKPSIKK